MAMDATELSAKIVALFRDQARTLYPDVVKSVTVRPVPREDGTMDYDVTENRGPLEVDTNAIVPLANAIALAVIDHIQDSAEVDDTVAGQKWRIT